MNRDPIGRRPQDKLDPKIRSKANLTVKTPKGSAEGKVKSLASQKVRGLNVIRRRLS